MNITIRKITRAEKRRSSEGFSVFEAMCREIMGPVSDVTSLNLEWYSVQGNSGHLAHIQLPDQPVKLRVHGQEHILSEHEFGAIAYMMTYLNIHLSSDNMEIREGMMDYVQSVGLFIETFDKDRADFLEGIILEVLRLYRLFIQESEHPTIH